MVAPEDIEWKLTPADSWTACLSDIKNQLGTHEYERNKASIKEMLCNYFSAHESCNGALGDNIRPVGASQDGGKVIKFRWGLPGGGKSGGLRLVFVAYCDAKRVALVAAFRRRDDPQEGDIRSAVEDSIL